MRCQKTTRTANRTPHKVQSALAIQIACTGSVPPHRLLHHYFLV
ncbi:MAG: hypothetical protein U1F68_13080 [Gammaproteobacteria bacterium]